MEGLSRECFKRSLNSGIKLSLKTLEVPLEQQDMRKKELEGIKKEEEKGRKREGREANMIKLPVSIWSKEPDT